MAGDLRAELPQQPEPIDDHGLAELALRAAYAGHGNAAQRYKSGVVERYAVGHLGHQIARHADQLGVYSTLIARTGDTVPYLEVDHFFGDSNHGAGQAVADRGGARQLPARLGKAPVDRLFAQLGGLADAQTGVGVVPKRVGVTRTVDDFHLGAAADC